MKASDLTARHGRQQLAGIVRDDELGDEAIVDRWARAVWSHLVEPGDGIAGRLIEALGAEGALRTLLAGPPRDQLGGLSLRELTEAWKRWQPRVAADLPATALEIARRQSIRIVVPTDPDWPDQLDDLDAHAPVCLWVRGDVGALRRLRPSVAVVGARAATSYGEHVAVEIASDLAGGGVPIVSGAAYGIDGAAHRAALAVGGLTVALLAGGADRSYPVGHAQLIDRIAATGAVISEVPCGSAPTKWRFLQRNRLIAALAGAVVVVEAGWRSGSLNTAGHGVALGRPLGAVPGPVTSAASAGCHRLLREFGAACITDGKDVRELLGLVDGRAEALDEALFTMGAEDGRPWTDHRTRATDALSTRSWRDVTDVARRSGMSVAAIESLLGLLALEGLVQGGPQGWRKVSVS